MQKPKRHCQGVHRPVEIAGPGRGALPAIRRRRIKGPGRRPRLGARRHALAEGGEARCVDALPAPHPAAARRHGGHGRVGTPRVSDVGGGRALAGSTGTRRAAAPLAAVRKCASPFSMRAFFRRAAVARRQPQRETSAPRRGGMLAWRDGRMGAVESDGGFVRAVCRAVGVRLASTRRRPVCHRRVR